MIKLNCELASPKETKEVEVSVNLTYKVKVGGSDKNDMEDSIRDFINEHIIPSGFEPDDVEMNIEWV